jgi:hypothetical protein
MGQKYGHASFTLSTKYKNRPIMKIMHCWKGKKNKMGWTWSSLKPKWADLVKKPNWAEYIWVDPPAMSQLLFCPWLQ